MKQSQRRVRKASGSHAGRTERGDEMQRSTSLLCPRSKRTVEVRGAKAMTRADKGKIRGKNAGGEDGVNNQEDKAEGSLYAASYR